MGLGYVPAASSLQIVVALNVLLILGSSVYAEETGCAPTVLVNVALAKAQDIASKELGTAKAQELLKKLKEKGTAVNGEVCFLTQDFADFGRIVAQFFDDHLSNTISSTARQKSNDTKPSFAQADEEDTGTSSKCSCLDCPSGHESWCPPKRSTPQCCPDLCSDIFSTISVGALTGLRGSGVDSCCKESARPCSFEAKSRNSMTGSSRPNDPPKSSTSRGPLSGSPSDNPPKFNFGDSRVVRSSPSNPVPGPSSSPSPIAENLPHLHAKASLPAHDSTLSSRDNATPPVAESDRSGGIVANSLSEVVLASTTPHPESKSSPSPKPSIASPSHAVSSPKTPSTEETPLPASFSPDLPVSHPSDEHDKAQVVSETAQRSFPSLSPTATPSVSAKLAGSSVPVSAIASHQPRLKSSDGKMKSLSSPSISTLSSPTNAAQSTPYVTLESTPPRPPRKEIPRPQPQKPAPLVPKSGVPSVNSPVPSLHSTTTDTTWDAPGPLTIGSDAELPPFSFISANAGIPGGTVPEGADENSNPVSSPQAASALSISQFPVPVSPQATNHWMPDSNWEMEDESIPASPEAMTR